MKSIYKIGTCLIGLGLMCICTFGYGQGQGKDTLSEESVPEMVNIAYQKMPAWMVTGAVSSVSGTSLQQSFFPDFPSKLAGKIAGLTVSPSNLEPGYEEISLYCRGVNTFGVGGREMLILVDGVESNIIDLVPEEIASVALLKDASATAMYGSRGANGVLLVTTKRGKETPLKITFSTQQGFQQATRLPDFLGSYDYARLYNEALVNDGKSEQYSSADLSAYQSGSNKFLHPDVDWYDEVLRNAAPMSNYNLNFSGGSSTVRYFVMMNYLQNNSVLLKTGDESEFSVNGKYSRYNFRSNVDIELSKNLSAQITVGGTVVDKSNPSGSNMSELFNTMSVIPPNAFPVYNPNGSISRNSLYSNPLGDLLNTGFYTSNGRTLQTILGLTEKLDMITEGLGISARVSFNSYFLSQSNKSRTYESFAISDDGTGNIVYDKYGLNTSLAGSEEASDQYRNMTIQSFLTYDRSVGNHDIRGLIVLNADDYTVSGDTYPVKHRNVSGRLTYANSEKYIAEMSLSYMGSENFAKDNRFGFFPAASLGWIVSNESFLENSSLINFLKVRASYGMVGNDKIGGSSFMFEQYYPYTAPYYFGTENAEYLAIIQGSPANTMVTWEKEKSFNFGFEATLADHLNVSIDLFNRNRYDILVQPNETDPDFMGYVKPYLNQGETNNKGLEVSIAYQNDQSKDLQFFVEASLWYFQNEVVYNSEALQLYDYLYQTGQPIDQPFGLVADGFFANDADINNPNTPQQIWASVQPGDVKYVDQNGDMIIDQRDLYPVGNTELPNLTAGINLGLKYKGFDFSAFIQAVSQRTITFDGYLFHAFQNNGKAGSIAMDRWTPATASSASYPRLSSMNNENNYRYSSLWQRNGSFIKLRSIELGYMLPANISNAVLVENARVFLNGTNLLSLDHMEGYRDPEIGLGYPAMRSFSLGVRIQF